MKKLVLAGFSILAVGLLVLGSQTNVVGYQTVQTSQQNLLKERINQKDLLFQTICDLANNKEIQKVILESQGSKYLNPFPAPQLTSFPTITTKQLNCLYYFGVVLSKTMGKTQMASLKEHPLLSVQSQEKINSILGNNTILSEEMAQLSLLNCHCLESNRSFPVVCFILGILMSISMLSYYGFIAILIFLGLGILALIGINLVVVIEYIINILWKIFNCGASFTYRN